MTEEVACSFCQDCSWTEPVQAGCHHVFCWPCIHEASRGLIDRPTCPVCASPIACIRPVYGLPGEISLPPEARGQFGDRPRSEVVVGTSEPSGAEVIEGDSQDVSETRPQRAHRLPQNLRDDSEVYRAGTSHSFMSDSDVDDPPSEVVTTRARGRARGRGTGRRVRGNSSLRGGRRTRGQIRLGEVSVASDGRIYGVETGGVDELPELIQSRGQQAGPVEDLPDISPTRRESSPENYLPSISPRRSRSPHNTNEMEFFPEEDIASRPGSTEASSASRFRPENVIPGSQGTSHGVEIVRKVHETVLNEQLPLSSVNWSQLVRNIRQDFPQAFPSSASVNGAGRVCRNVFNKFIARFREEERRRARSGAVGGPETSHHRDMREILTVNQSQYQLPRRTPGRRVTAGLQTPPELISSVQAGAPGRSVTAGLQTPPPVQADPRPDVQQNSNQPNPSQEDPDNRRDQLLGFLTPILPSLIERGSEEEERATRRERARSGAELRASSMAVSIGGEGRVRERGRPRVEALVDSVGAQAIVGNRAQSGDLMRFIMVDNMQRREKEEEYRKLERERWERMQASERQEQRQYRLDKMQILGAQSAGIKKDPDQTVTFIDTRDRTDGSQPLPIELRVTDSLPDLIRDLKIFMEIKEDVEGLVRNSDGLQKIISSIPKLPPIVELGLKINRHKTYIIILDGPRESLS